MIHLRSHPVEHGLALGIVYLAGILHRLQDILLRLLGLAHRHIDARQRVVARRDHIRVATLQVKLITLLGILRRLFEMPLADIDQRHQIQQITSGFLQTGA